MLRWWLCVKEAAGLGPADGGSGSNIVGITPDDTPSDRVGRLMNGGQAGRSRRGLPRSVPPVGFLSAAPATKLAATYWMGLEPTGISLGETVVGGPREEARLG